MSATALSSECGSHVEYLDSTPLPHMIFSLAAQNLPWWQALAELVDNSFDAKATRVSIKSSGKTVVVTDDGHGIPDIKTAITLGGHLDHGGRSLGRYGVGLKDAWLSVGDRVEITTTRAGVKRRIDISRESYSRHGWRIPVEPGIKTDERPGTRIVLHIRDGRNKPAVDCWEALAWAFYPALISGKQIVHGTDKVVKPIAPCVFPSLSESVDEVFEVCGKEVRIVIGIMVPGQKIYRGPFWVQYGHRNITRTSLGVGSFSDMHLAGIIQLGDGWKLTKNKDDFDDHKEELGEAINSRIIPILSKAEQMNQDIECATLTSEICGWLNSAINNPKREKRTRKNESHGTILPKHTGRTRTRSKKIHESLPGNIISATGGKPRTGLTLSWYSDEDDQTHGEYDYFANRLRLNFGHEFVRVLREEKNAMALTAVAAAILSDHHCIHDGASRLLCQKREFSPVFGELTKTMKVTMQ